MLSKDEFDLYCDRIGISAQGRAYLERVRSSPPSRRVKAGSKNVPCRYPSRKMGVTIQAESHRNELALVYEMEYDPDVLEYYDQPEPIILNYQSKRGRPVGVRHTTDYFALKKEAAGWIECKTEQDLQKLAEEQPNRYMKDENGQWRCPPGEEYAEQRGFFYRVRSSAEINPTLVRNIVFLEDYFRDDTPLVDEDAAAMIHSLVGSEPGIRLDELLRQTHDGGASSDDVYILIATEQIYVDLSTLPLAEPDRAPVFLDVMRADAYALAVESQTRKDATTPYAVNVKVGAAVLWDGRAWRIVNVGNSAIWLQAEDGTPIELSVTVFETLVGQGKLLGLPEPIEASIHAKVAEILAQASPEALEEACRRARIVRALLAGREPEDEVTESERTLRRWKQAYREAQEEFDFGFAGVISQEHLRGNREPKLSEALREFMDQYIEEKYENIRQMGKFEAHSLFKKACREKGYDPPHYNTFVAAINGRPRYQQIRKRQGRRAAYQYEPFYWELDQSTPRHGDRPFEIVHFDHTQLDLWLICPQTGRCLGRPWFSTATDAFSRRFLAVYTTFDPPSYRTNMMLIREIVRRFHRLPQIAVVDGGSDFKSAYFETTLAMYEIIKKERPGGKPRYGSVCERLFGTTNTQFVYTLLGNTQAATDVRLVTKENDPRLQAVWPMSPFYANLCKYCYEVYDTIEHSSLLQTPETAFTAGMELRGKREHRLIPCDDTFMVLTMPAPKGSGGTRMVQINRGVQIRHIYYSNDAFRNPEVERTKVPVRYDPFNIGLAYAFVRGIWVPCLSEYYSILQGRTEREIQLIGEVLCRRHQLHSKDRFNLTAKKLADFLTSVHEEEAVLLQQLRDLESRAVRATILTGCQPPSPARAVLSGQTCSPGSEPGMPERGKIVLDVDKLEVYGEF